ncbi:hypothetical protein [Modestobacter roseus]|uniref:hypothetical protein n=1 Tax=Modestobacter roseus TaxID=1181884 RepID=UPI001AA1140D|nr:hypothetical protein [Modestobacter roseus]
MAGARRYRVADVVGAAGAAATFLGHVVTGPLLRSRRRSWGATPGEAAMALPGDDLVPAPRWQATRAVTIDAAAADVWPWLVQIGQGRAGFYSHQLLENLVGCDVHDRFEVVPELQQLAVGDEVRLARGGPALPVAVLERGRHLVLGGPAGPLGRRGDPTASIWGFHLRPTGPGSCRLLTRSRTSYGRGLLPWLAFGPVNERASYVMERRMLSTVKALAEERT